MPILRFVVPAGVALLLATSDARAEVNVVFQQPEAYTDADLGSTYGAKSREATLTELRTHLQRLGERYLSGDQTLTVEVQDIDLAGRYDLRHLVEPRVLTEVTWPKIAVRYTLTRNGATLASGEETIKDMNYLTRPERRKNEPLSYEKAMLDEWFRSLVAGRRPI
jgi:hypothetical protein